MIRQNTDRPVLSADGAVAYFIYMLRCSDESLYTGITRDLARRLAEHRARSPKSKYTIAHPVIRMECGWIAPDRSTALKLEYRIKHLTKSEKERLVKDPAWLSERLPDFDNCLPIGDGA